MSHQAYQEHWSLRDFAKNAPPPGWEEVFALAEDALFEVNKHVNRCSRIFPLRRNIFRAFDYARPEEIKVVILGQDPYPTMLPDKSGPVAQGLAFSTPPGVPIAASLKNIFAQLNEEYKGAQVPFQPPHCGDLTGWAKQGVLLLNCSLTLDPDLPKGSKEQHVELKFWHCFVVLILKYLRQVNPQLVFLLWGLKAQAVYNLCKFRDSEYVLMSSHPSDMAKGAREPFMGNGHFRKCNKLLAKSNRGWINWRLDSLDGETGPEDDFDPLLETPERDMRRFMVFFQARQFIADDVPPKTNLDPEGLKTTSP